MKQINTGLKKAIETAGSEFKLAKLLNAHKSCSHQKVQGWVKNGVPAVWVLLIEFVSGVSRHEIRPDIYPEEK